MNRWFATPVVLFGNRAECVRIPSVIGSFVQVTSLKFGVLNIEAPLNPEKCLSVSRSAKRKTSKKEVVITDLKETNYSV